MKRDETERLQIKKYLLPPTYPETPADGQQPDLLSDLLSAGVITQAEYEALTAAQTAA
jgi:hypothetical protein